MSESRRVGGFRILNDLASGTGSQGSVVRAICEEPSDSVPGVAVGDVVALKLMGTQDDDARAWERFERRTRLLMSIDHPNIVKYLGCFVDLGPFSSSYVVVMELLEGESLKERLAAESGGLDADVAVAVVNAALTGLAAAEGAGIVHRDIKPGNIFLCRDGGVKLIDFEISRDSVSATLSSTGRFAGTFDYMAPEFADEKFRGDARSDVFSMGVVFHEAMTGMTPYAQARQAGEQADFAFLSRWSQRVEGLCAIHVRSSVRRVLSHADEVMRGALAENPEQRFASAAEFLEAMKTIRFRELRNGANAYRLLKIIGKGGFGEVFKARLRSTGELVAVKHLLKSAYGDRFRREARVMRQLDDPAFVRFVDYFETSHSSGNEAFLVMAFLPGMPGSSLRDAIKRHKGAALAAKDVLKAFALYAQALATMHRQGIYHRDIKPSNLYYPEQDPGKSAIMDLGIARDVNGTATAGQVPGTLDYMPPEVVVGGSRGDAGMDIYALGLCFYEALSGRMAYPRLPNGAEGFQAFFERARSGVPPTFAGKEVEAIPGLRELLCDMTALDPAFRIHDAGQLHRRIVALAASAAAGAPRPQTQRIARPTAPARPLRYEPEPETRDTAQTGGGASAPARRDAGGLAIKVCWGVLAVAVIVVGVTLFGDPLKGAYARWQESNERKRLEKIQSEMRKREATALNAERARVESVRAEAVSAADGIVKRLQTEALTPLAAGNLVDEWKVNWQGNADVADIYPRECDRLGMELKAKKTRDSERAENERKKARDLAKELQIKQEKSEAEARQRQLEKEEQAKRDEVLGRERRDAEKLATEQAGQLCARYADEKESPQAVDAARAVWETNWERYRNERFHIKAVREMDEARIDRSLLESGRAVAAECDRWLANIGTVTAENVRNWRTNIERAQNELRQAIGKKKISAKSASVVQSRIDACGRWTVGVIDNKTHETLDFCGTKIESVSSRAVIFKDGMPDGAALVCAGYEPIRVREDRFESQAFLVLPRDLKETRGTTLAKVPLLPAGILCYVDGVETKPGEVKLRKGRHHAVYRNEKETYGGIRDFKDQDVTFMTEDDGVADIPGPSSTWTRSVEFEAREKNAELIGRGERIVELVKKSLEPEPIAGRRDRLQKAYAVINDWRTAEALAVLGEGVERNLRSLYEEERRRVRGIVKNETKVVGRVETDVGVTDIPVGGSAMVTFESQWTGDAHVTFDGYEFVMLPRVSSDFEDRPFVVTPNRLVPLPVAVTVPELEPDVRCEVDGKVASGMIELRPGDYEGVYLKPDHLRQPFTFKVEIGKPLRLPRPAKWNPSGAFSAFSAALNSFNEGAVEKAKKLAEEIGTIEDPARRQELQDLKRAIELRRRLKGEK